MWPWSQHPIGCTLTGIIILILFFSPFGQTRWDFLSWINTVDPESSTWHPTHHSYFYPPFSGYFYHNEISIESAQGYIWNFAMKCTGYPMKYRNEICRGTFEKSQWNVLGIQWNIAMKYPGIHLKYRNEMCWVSNEISQWNALGI